jgi:hypothetical protein
MSASWEVSSRADCQDIPCLFWNPKAHYYIHKGQPFVLILSYLNPILTLPPYFFKTHFNIILYLDLNGKAIPVTGREGP